MDNYKKRKQMDMVDALKVISIDEIQQSLEALHRDVSENISASRRRSIATHNKNTNTILVNFQVGDFVLSRIAQPSKSHNLSFRWNGPHHIFRLISSHVYLCKNINTLKLEHSRQL